MHKVINSKDNKKCIRFSCEKNSNKPKRYECVLNKKSNAKCLHQMTQTWSNHLLMIHMEPDAMAMAIIKISTQHTIAWTPELQWHQPKLTYQISKWQLASTKTYKWSLKWTQASLIWCDRSYHFVWNLFRFSFLLFCKKKVPNRSVYCHWLSVWIPNEFANLICYRLFIVSCIVYKGGRYYRLYTGNNNKQFTMPYTQSVWFTTDSWRVSTATLEQRTFFGVHFTLLRITQRTTETDSEIVLLFIAFMSKILHLSHLDHKTIRCWQQLVEQKYAFERFGKLVNSNNKSSTSPQSCCKRTKSSNIRLKFMKCDQKWLILAHTFDGRARTRP